MERREFFIKSLKAGAVVALPLVYASCSKDEDDEPLGPTGSLTIDLDSSQYSGLNNEGQSVVVNRIIIANTGNDEFVALSATCTHQGFTINYNQSNRNFPCPGHGAIFSLAGSVLQGPATTGVRRYTVTREGNILTIT